MKWKITFIILRDPNFESEQFNISNAFIISRDLCEDDSDNIFIIEVRFNYYNLKCKIGV